MKLCKHADQKSMVRLRAPLTHIWSEDILLWASVNFVWAWELTLTSGAATQNVFMLLSLLLCIFEAISARKMPFAGMPLQDFTKNVDEGAPQLGSSFGRDSGRGNRCWEKPHLVRQSFMGGLDLADFKPCFLALKETPPQLSKRGPEDDVAMIFDREPNSTAAK